jgi:hypothetical protein
MLTVLNAIISIISPVAAADPKTTVVPFVAV